MKQIKLPALSKETILQSKNETQGRRKSGVEDWINPYVIASETVG